MMNPGSGYRVTRTASGTSIDTTEPFPSLSQQQGLHPFQVRYDGVNVRVRSGTVNNEILPDQEFPVAKDVVKQIYIECHASSAPTAFPTSVTCDFADTVPADDSTTGYKLIATITNGVVQQHVYTALGGERHEYENPVLTYYYFWRS